MENFLRGHVAAFTAWHDVPRVVLKSVFSLAARRTNVAEGGTEVGTRAGELKTYWTNPLPGRGRYGR
jgi:hypothetical protein